MFALKKINDQNQQDNRKDRYMRTEYFMMKETEKITTLLKAKTGKAVRHDTITTYH